MYQAPELEDGIVADPSQDIYSLGITMLTVWGGTQVAIRDGVIVNWPKDLNGEFAWIIQNMVEWDPEQRWTAAKICLLMGIEQQMPVAN
jgi:hypothetical protein